MPLIACEERSIGARECISDMPVADGSSEQRPRLPSMMFDPTVTFKGARSTAARS